MAASSVALVVLGCWRGSRAWSSGWLPRTGTGATGESKELWPIWANEVARGTIANILKERGLEPAPERERKTTWAEFLRRHREVIVAADFFTIEAWTRQGLTRFMVLFLIDLSSRRVEIAGVVRGANGLWMSQVARNLSDAAEGFLIGKRPDRAVRNLRCSQASRGHGSSCQAATPIVPMGVAAGRRGVKR